MQRCPHTGSLGRPSPVKRLPLACLLLSVLALLSGCFANPYGEVQKDGGFRKQVEAGGPAGLQSRHLLQAKLLKQDRADATDTDALQGGLQICIHTSAASLLQRKPLGFTALFQARIHSVPHNPRAPPAI